MMRARDVLLAPLSVAVVVGAVVGIAGSRTAGGLALLLLPVVLLIADAAAVVVATVLGIDIYRLHVGQGRALRDLRLGHRSVIVHAVPTGVGWNGRLRGSRLVRLRFALAHAATLGVLIASGASAWQVPVLRGLAVAVLVLAAASFLPWTDGWGRSAPGRALLLCRTASDDVVDDWSQSRAGGAAFRAALAGRHEEAIALADAALALDPADRAGLDALAVSSDATGDTAAALRAAELAWLAARRSPTIAVAGSYAWALVRARESGLEPPEWSARARGALAEVDRLGGDGWEIDGTRALLAVLTGRPADAVEHLQRPLRMTVDPLDRASELLTLALARAAMGDVDGQRAALDEAQALSPDHPRLPLVLRQLTAHGPCPAVPQGSPAPCATGARRRACE